MPANTITVKVLGDATQLERTLTTMEGTVGASMSKVAGHADKASGSIEKMEGSGNKGAGGVSNLAKGLGGLAAGFAAVEVVKGITEEFDANQAATQKLSAAMRQAGENDTPKFREELEKTKKANESLGFSNAETTDSVARLRIAGVDTTRAMEIQTTIMDLARAKHMSLADATDITIKAMQGSAKAFKDLNIEAPPHLATTAKLDTANQNLAKSQDAVNKADEAAAKAKEKAAAAFQNYSDVAAKYGENSKQAKAAETAYHNAVAASGNALAASQKAHENYAKSQDAVKQATADVGDRTHQLGAVIDELNKKVGGQAVAANQTAAQKVQDFKVKITDMGAELVGNAMPALNFLLDGLGFLADHMNIVLPILGVMIGLFVAWKTAMLIADVIDGVSTAVGGLSKAMVFLAANPIFLVIAAVVAIVAALIILEAKFHWIEATARAVAGGLSAVWDDIQRGFHRVVDFAEGVLGWLRSNWPLILGILTGPIGLAVVEIIKHWDEITGFLTGLPAKFGSAFESVGGAIASGFKGVINAAIIDPIDAALNAIGDMGGGIGPVSVHVRDAFGGTMPQIPRLHSGGMVPGAPGSEMLALLQAGERVLPSRAGSGGHGDQVVNVYVSTPASPHQIGREVAWAIKTGLA